MFTVKAKTQPEVASHEAHGGLPFLETSSPLHPCKLLNYTGKSWRVRKGERGRIREKEQELFREVREWMFK